MSAIIATNHRAMANPALYGKIDTLPRTILEFAFTFLHQKDVLSLKATRYLYLTSLPYKNCRLRLADDAAADESFAKIIQAARRYQLQFTTITISGRSTLIRNFEDDRRKGNIDVVGPQKIAMLNLIKKSGCFSETSIALLSLHPVERLKLDGKIINFSSRFFELLGQISTLTALEITKNIDDVYSEDSQYEMTDTDLSALSKLKLRTLVTSYSKITDNGLQYLFGMPLETLKIQLPAFIKSGESIYDYKYFITQGCLKHLKSLPIQELCIDNPDFQPWDNPINHTLRREPCQILKPILEALPQLRKINNHELDEQTKKQCLKYGKKERQHNPQQPASAPAHSTTNVTTTNLPLPNLPHATVETVVKKDVADPLVPDANVANIKITEAQITNPTLLTEPVAESTQTLSDKPSSLPTYEPVREMPQTTNPTLPTEPVAKSTQTVSDEPSPLPTHEPVREMSQTTSGFKSFFDNIWTALCRFLSCLLRCCRRSEHP